MIAKNEESFLQDYILRKRPDISTLISPAYKKKKIAYAIVASVILALFIVYYCLYHKGLFLFLILIPLYLVVTLSRPKNTFEEVIGEIRRHPDEDMNKVIESKLSGFIPYTQTRRTILIIASVTVLALLGIFARPHIIYEENNMGGYSVRYYSKSLIPDSIVVIPETHNNRPVNEIRGETFMNMQSLQGIVLPSGLTEIRGDTFRNCDGLTSIDIPSKVTRIGGHAFYDCDRLQTVTLPSGLCEIGSSAFRSCDKLLTIEIPSKCSVASNAFKESPTSIIRK